MEDLSLPPLDGEAGWEALRAAFFPQRRINLNPGTLGTPSAAVTAAMERFRQETEGWPLGQYTRGREAMKRCRDRVQGLWPHPAAALGHGTTAQISALVPALARTFGPLTVLTTTDEHEGGVAGFARHPGVRVRAVPPERLLDAIAQERPTLVFLSHALWTDGRILDVEAVVQAAGEGFAVVDVAQSLGAVEVPRAGDVVVGSLHKWVAGPPGTGVSWFSERALARLEGTTWAGHLVDPGAAAAAFEPAGAQDFGRWAGLEAALALFAAVGPARAAARARTLGERLAQGLSSVLRGVDPLFLGPAGWQAEPAVAPGGVVTVRFTAGDPYPLYQRLDASGVHVKCIKGEGRNQLRFGAHWSETMRRIDEALARIDEAQEAR